MEKRLITRWTLIIALALTTIACGIGVNSGTPAAKPVANPSPDDELLGEKLNSIPGGFSVRAVKGYEINNTSGIITMAAKGADTQTGPGIAIMGGLSDKEISNQQLLDTLREVSPDIQFTNDKPITISGQNGLLFDTSGTVDGQSIKGKMAVAMPGPKQKFVILGFAPAAKWDEISPIFNAVLASVAFFQAVPVPTDAPAADSNGRPTMPPLPEQPAAQETPASPDGGQGELRQWAISAVASSQFGESDWSAMQAAGEPDVQECADDVKAWASKGQYSLDWIELKYATPVVPSKIIIYQSYNPTQIVKIQVTDINGKSYTAWTGTPEKIDSCPDKMTITLDVTGNVVINKVRITVDQTVLGLGWDEIDAVELLGYPQDQ